MFIRTHDGFIDFDMELLIQMCRVIDQQLDAFEERCQVTPDADGYGLFDWAEHVVGVGFIACQCYLTATYACVGIPKVEAMQLGPKHQGSGRPIVAGINAAANFWKHYPEWPLDRDTHRQDAIRCAFDDLGFPADGEYPLSGILTELTTGIARFGPLQIPLEQWRDELVKRKSQPAADG